RNLSSDASQRPVHRLGKLPGNVRLWTGCDEAHDPQPPGILEDVQPFVFGHRCVYLTFVIVADGVLHCQIRVAICSSICKITRRLEPDAARIPARVMAVSAQRNDQCCESTTSPKTLRQGAASPTAQIL